MLLVLHALQIKKSTIKSIHCKMFSVLHALLIMVRQTFSKGYLDPFINLPCFCTNLRGDHDKKGLAFNGKSTATPSPCGLRLYHQSSGKYLSLARSSFSKRKLPPCFKALPLPFVTNLQTSRSIFTYTGDARRLLRALVTATQKLRQCSSSLLSVTGGVA